MVVAAKTMGRGKVGTKNATDAGGDVDSAAASTVPDLPAGSDASPDASPSPSVPRLVGLFETKVVEGMRSLVKAKPLFGKEEEPTRAGLFDVILDEKFSEWTGPLFKHPAG